MIDKVLEWEGPTNHFAEDRWSELAKNGEKIHLFHRAVHYTDFIYLGKATIIDSKSRIGSPSLFKLGIREF